MTRFKKENPDYPTLQHRIKGWNQETYQEFLEQQNKLLWERNGVKLYNSSNHYYAVYKNHVYLGFGYSGEGFAHRLADSPEEVLKDIKEADDDSIRYSRKDYQVLRSQKSRQGAYGSLQEYFFTLKSQGFTKAQRENNMRGAMRVFYSYY